VDYVVVVWTGSESIAKTGNSIVIVGILIGIGPHIATIDCLVRL
jgi:hypothetical protein